MTCNLCNHTYNGSICPACGAVYTAEKDAAATNQPKQYLEHVSQMLFLEHTMNQYIKKRSIALVIALACGWLLSIGKPFIFFAGYSLMSYAFLSILFLPWSRHKKYPNAPKAIEAVVNGVVGLSFLWFNSNYAYIVQNMFIGKILPVMMFILIAFLPIAAMKTLWREEMAQIQSYQIDRKHWEKYIGNLSTKDKQLIPKAWLKQITQ